MIQNRKPCAQKPNRRPHPPRGPACGFHARMISMSSEFYDDWREYMSFPQKITIDQMVESTKFNHKQYEPLRPRKDEGV